MDDGKAGREKKGNVNLDYKSWDHVVFHQIQNYLIMMIKLHFSLFMYIFLLVEVSIIIIIIIV